MIVLLSLLFIKIITVEQDALCAFVPQTLRLLVVLFKWGPHAEATFYYFHIINEGKDRNFILFTRTPAAFWKTIIFLSNAECRLNCNTASSQLSRWWRKILMQMVWACHGPAPWALLGWHLNWDSKSKWELEAINSGCVGDPEDWESLWTHLQEALGSGRDTGTCVCMKLHRPSWEHW